MMVRRNEKDLGMSLKTADPLGMFLTSSSYGLLWISTNCVLVHTLSGVDETRPWHVNKLRKHWGFPLKPA